MWPIKNECDGRGSLIKIEFVFQIRFESGLENATSFWRRRKQGGAESNRPMKCLRKQAQLVNEGPEAAFEKVHDNILLKNDVNGDFLTTLLLIHSVGIK